MRSAGTHRARNRCRSHRRIRRHRGGRLAVNALVVLVVALVTVLVAPAPRGQPGSAERGPLTAAMASSPSFVSERRIDRQHLVASRSASGRYAARFPFVPTEGSGELNFISVRKLKPATGRSVTFTLEIEGGLPVAADEVAETVATVLEDRRGWQTEAHVRFLPVSARAGRTGVEVDIRITLASPGLADRLCAPLDTAGQLSCWQRGRAVLNAQRWVSGATTYGLDLTAYRGYLINHEVGHGLGRGHARCPAPGRRAPVMVQQTKSLEGCTPWPWATGAAN